MSVSLVQSAKTGNIILQEIKCQVFFLSLMKCSLQCVYGMPLSSAHVHAHGVDLPICNQIYSQSNNVGSFSYNTCTNDNALFYTCHIQCKSFLFNLVMSKREVVFGRRSR